MARLHFVKSARKANKAAGVRKGESYYWWAFRTGRSSRKCFSKTKPRRSQLTQSEFYGAMYDAEDAVRDAAADCRSGKMEPADLATVLRDAASEVENARDECQSKYDNMESAFPNGCPTMETLQSRMDACEEIMQSLEDAAQQIEDLEPDEGDADAEPENEQAADLAEQTDWTYE